MMKSKIALAEQAMVLAEKHDLDELEIPGIVRFRRRPVKLIPTAVVSSTRGEAEERKKEAARVAQREKRLEADLERFEGGGL